MWCKCHDKSFEDLAGHLVSLAPCLRIATRVTGDGDSTPSLSLARRVRIAPGVTGGGMLAFIAYICGESVVAGILAALLFSIFGILLAREIVLKLTGRRE